MNDNHSDRTVLVLLGSLRAASVNRRLAAAAVAAAPEGVVATIHDGLGNLPHYDQDIDTADDRPEAVRRFLAAVDSADAVLLVTPEYNGTMSAVLKDAIDWASRPARNSPLTGKPAAVVGATFGQYGGVWAQGEVRRALGVAGARVVEEPVVAVGGAHARFEETAPERDAALLADLRRLHEALVELAAEAAVESAA